MTPTETTENRLIRLVEALEDGWVPDGQDGFRCAAHCGHGPQDAQYPKLWELGLHFDDCPFQAARRQVQAIREARGQ